MKHRAGFALSLTVGLLVVAGCEGQDEGSHPLEMARAAGGGPPCATVVDCEDQDPCTGEACVEGACAYQPLFLDQDLDGFMDRLCGGLDCDDGDDRIHPGAVEGPFDAPSCADGVDNDCDGMADAQDPDCIYCETAQDCEQGNPCTVPSCQGGRCLYTQIDGLCEDGDPCTAHDRCVLGVCVGSPLDADEDGYVAASCGGTDCDDERDDIHPGAWEGTPLDSSCADGLDNDCDGLTDAEEPTCQGTSLTVELVTDREVADNEAELVLTLTVGTATRLEQIPISYSGWVRVALPSEGGMLWVEALSLAAGTVSVRIPLPVGDLSVTVEGLAVSLPAPARAPMDAQGDVSMAFELQAEGLFSVLLDTVPILEDYPISMVSYPMEASGRWTSRGDTDGDGKEDFDLLVTAPLSYRVEVDDIPLLGAVAVTVEGIVEIGLRGEAL